MSVPPSGSVPALVLDECIIRAQVHGHRLTADGTFRDKLGRYFHIILKLDHIKHEFFVIVGLVVAGYGALEQAVVALRIEKSLLVEARLLKLVIDVRGDDKIIIVLHKLEKYFVCAVVNVRVAVTVDMP